MFTSLLKTFLLSLPMSMGGLCNSGNSYVHNAYVRRNVATNNDASQYDDSMPSRDTYYVLKENSLDLLFTSLPSYVQFTSYQSGNGTFYESYSFAFTFLALQAGTDSMRSAVPYYGMAIFKFASQYQIRLFKNTNYSFDTSDDYEHFIYYNIDTHTVTHGNGPTYEAFYVQYPSIVDDYIMSSNSVLNRHDKKNDWAVFNYFFRKGLTSFVFSSNFNYNAPYNVSLDSQFITDSTFQSNNLNVSVYKTVYTRPFISNGVYYNMITLVYKNGYNTPYFKDDGDIDVDYGTSAGYYYQMYYAYVYIDDVTHTQQTAYEVVVNQRTFGTYSFNNISVDYILKESYWVDTAFQTIYFLDDISSDLILDLTKLNSGTGINFPYQDIGLGNAFDLMKTGFLGLNGLFAITIFPGVSLGFFIFLPLLMGIVVLVFRAVKK